jgi:hypothetical protein
MEDMVSERRVTGPQLYAGTFDRRLREGRQNLDRTHNGGAEEPFSVIFAYGLTQPGEVALHAKAELAGLRLVEPLRENVALQRMLAQILRRAARTPEGRAL